MSLQHAINEKIDRIDHDNTTQLSCATEQDNTKEVLQLLLKEQRMCEMATD